MTFEQHIANGPLWVQWWVIWLMIVNLTAILFIVR